MTTKPASQSPPADAYPPLTELPDPPKPPDAMQQRRHITSADQILRAYYRARPDVLVSGDGYLCQDARDALRAPRPDCLVALGVPVPPEIIETVANGYVINEIGQPPDFVLEVASRSTGQRDYTVKRDTYARYGVTEYWRFDHTGGQYHDIPLAGDRLVNGEYEPIPVETGTDGVTRGYSAVLGLELHWRNRRLRFWNPATQEYLPELTEALTGLTESLTELNSERAARQDAEAGWDSERAARQDAEAGWDSERAARQDAEAGWDSERAARQDAEARAAAAEQRVRQLEAELRRRQSP